MPTPPDNGADTWLTGRRDRAEGPEQAPGQGPPDPAGTEFDSPAGPGSSWYGSAADGAAGKGPVRGYPPVPGQPPPMYPPGQFAPWNRGHGARDTARRADPDAGRGPARAGWQAARPEGARPAPGSGYYGREQGPEADPGYSMLAVSDPAADVTSTQTWQAVGDGRATGIWTMPDRPAAGPGVPAVRQPRPAGAPAPEARLAVSQPAPALGEPSHPGAPFEQAAPFDRSAPKVAASRLDSAPGEEQAPARPGGPASRRDPAPAPQGTRRRASSHGGSRTGPHQVQRPKRKRPGSVKAAITCAVVLVVAAAGVLAYEVLRAKPKPPPAPVAAPRQTAVPSPSPSLGPYGHIGSRKSDAVALTVAQLYPASYSGGGGTVELTASSKSSACSTSISGAALQSAVSAASCSQVVRATYLSSDQGLMGTIGVFNLSTAAGAKKAAQSADASDFVRQLAAKHGKTAKIGQGTGIEEAAAKGHYLILIWAEFTSLRKPKTGAQRSQVEDFMTELLKETANVSLTNRWLTGTP
jgi:hypothetical protein